MNTCFSYSSAELLPCIAPLNMLNSQVQLRLKIAENWPTNKNLAMTWCPLQRWGICLTFFTAFKSSPLFIIYFSTKTVFLISCQAHSQILCTSKWQSRTKSHCLLILYITCIIYLAWQNSLSSSQVRVAGEDSANEGFHPTWSKAEHSKEALPAGSSELWCRKPWVSVTGAREFIQAECSSISSAWVYECERTTPNPFWLPISPLAVGKYRSQGVQGMSLGQTEARWCCSISADSCG